LISQIPHFWALVFEEAPPEVDHYISPSDSELFAECLQVFEAEKFELDVEPRSFILRFKFSPNKWFEDEVLEKRFWYRQTEDPWQGLVSEPVKIHWKQGYDLTKGLTDTVIAFWERFRLENDTSAKGFEKLQSQPEYRNLANKALNSDPRESFFTFFSFISSYRYVSAEESENAKQAEVEKREGRREKRHQGEPLDEPATRHNSPSSLDESVMVCRHGEELAFVLLDEVWLHAYRYFREKTLSN
jgi:Nucleosome assembly protein (NAP)